MRIILKVCFVLLMTACASGPLIKTARTTGEWGPLAPKVTPAGVLFQVEAPEATVVNLAGQFNGWSPEATALTKGPDGIWSIVLDLKKGVKHRYKFLIDGLWIPDPDNPLHEPSGYGSYNSVFELKKDKP